MSRIPDEVINEIRQKVNIEDVIGQYVDLTKRGNGYSASCPFHEDRNPSFSVHSGKQIYKCFSCGRGGNVFRFLQEIESISFVAAVQKTAEYANVALDEKYLHQATPAYSKTDQALFDIHQKAMEFYHYYLAGTKNGEEAYQYLLNRGLEAETINQFQLGLAPVKSELLAQYLSKDFKEADLAASGIFYINETTQELVDRFRGRIIFPLRNSSGSPVAFSGRAVKTTTQAEQQAKYINSPETPLFNKSKFIYNLDLARGNIRRLNQVLICEGYMDVIALNQAGFTQSVATMGTSITTEHLNVLSKIAKEIVFVFDGDEAGIKATARAFELSEEYRRQQFKSVTVPRNLDPDEWIKQKGANSFQQLINQANTAFEFQKQYLKQNYNFQDSQDTANYIEKILLLIAQLDSKIEQQLRIQELSQEFNLGENLLLEQFARIKQRNDVSLVPKTVNAAAVQDEAPAEVLQQPSYFSIKSRKAFQSEKVLIANLIYYQSAWKYIEQLNEMPVMFHSLSQTALFNLADYYYNGNHLPLTGIVDKIEDAHLGHFFTSIIWDFEALGYADEIMEDCLNVIQKAFIRQEITELKERCQLFISQQKQSEAEEMITKIMQLERKLKNFN